MAFFNTKQKEYIPKPIPPTPEPQPQPTPPTPSGGSTPNIPRPTQSYSSACTLYINSSENNVLNKTITTVYTTNITFDEPVSSMTPVIVVDGGNTDIRNCNYVYIEYTHRYYYIVNKEMINGNYWRLSLRTDVLMSFKTSINRLSGILERTSLDNENMCAPMFPDTYELLADEDLILYPSEEDINGVYCNILVTVGKTN